MNKSDKFLLPTDISQYKDTQFTSRSHSFRSSCQASKFPKLRHVNHDQYSRVYQSLMVSLEVL